jgi:hypothetical protein
MATTHGVARGFSDRSTPAWAESIGKQTGCYADSIVANPNRPTVANPEHGLIPCADRRYRHASQFARQLARAAGSRSQTDKTMADILVARSTLDIADAGPVHSYLTKLATISTSGRVAQAHRASAF